MMRLVVTAFTLFSFCHALSAQMYVDSGIQHYMKKEYREALADFESAVEMQAIFTESAVGKLHFYMGSTWLAIAESGKEDAYEKDASKQAYHHLQLVAQYSNEWETQVNNAYERLSSLLNERAQRLAKAIRKADELKEKLSISDRRIELYQLVHSMGVLSGTTLNLSRAIKESGDLIFAETTDVELIKQAKQYYEKAIPLYEQARYDDPFSKEIISDMITLAERLADQERLEEYEKLMELAGG